ncbi:uncharacterized protein [Amphiura filiformis]|uniref:uncharacterized protein n=1 Tax=Amphiura filiformis TaxID=82378 RepID=UPI003B21F86F
MKRSLKFQASDHTLHNAMGCADHLSTNTVQVDDIACTINQIQEESHKQVTDVRRLKELVDQLPELTREGCLPPKPTPEKPVRIKKKSIVSTMATKFTEQMNEGATEKQRPPVLLGLVDQLQQQREEDEQYASYAASASSERGRPERQSLTFGELAELLQAQQGESFRRPSTSSLPTSSRRPSTSTLPTSSRRPSTSTLPTSSRRPSTSTLPTSSRRPSTLPILEDEDLSRE